MQNDKPAVVIDNGSYTVKAGLAGEDVPSLVTPPIVGRPRPNNLRNKLVNHFIGENALQMQDSMNLVLRHPIRQGIIREWELMEKVWDYTYRVMGLEPSEHAVLMSETSVNIALKRQKMVEIMFESYHVPALYVASTANLALYGAGKTTGLVVDFGATVGHIVPIYEGYTLRRNIKKFNIGGETLTDYMQQLLALRGFAFTDNTGRGAVREIKEQTCFVAENFDREVRKADMSTTFLKTFDLPDGRTIKINNERFRVPEALFKPSFINHKTQGLPALIAETIKDTEITLHSDFYRNIILAGGTTMFPGIETRLKYEVEARAPPHTEVAVPTVEDRTNLAWLGGSKLAASEFFNSFWITREMYLENGVRKVQEKLF